MTWNCSAIDHAITFYPNGKVGPCCQIASDYLKPKSVINDPNRFADLKTANPPSACKICINDEANGLHSYRAYINSRGFSNGIQMVDIRNTNLCNLKCRYCGPHFSDKWAKELGLSNTVLTSAVPMDVITNDLSELYFTGGEPMLSPDHWDILKYCVTYLDSSKITLNYNTNLSTSTYKNIDISALWSQFKWVNLRCSVDAVGKPQEYIRSGSNWKKIDDNIRKFIKFPNLHVTMTPVVSILNIWWLDQLYNYATELNIPMAPIILHGPDYLALDVIPDSLKDRALHIVNQIQYQTPEIAQIKNLIENNLNQDLLLHTFSHIMLLDQRRNEKLWDLLPFAEAAQQRILENHEYE
jgi:sulfatase maturation enzyme AslB (radical SAM superfamily)